MLNKETERENKAWEMCIYINLNDTTLWYKKINDQRNQGPGTGDHIRATILRQGFGVRTENKKLKINNTRKHIVKCVK